MTEEIEFETYIRISSKIFGIYVLDKKKSHNIFFDEIDCEDNNDNINFNVLIEFIEKNILLLY